MSQAQGYVISAKSTTGARWRETWRYRALVLRFALRDVQVRYRHAVLGVLWALAQPAALTVIATLVVHRWLAVPEGGLPFVLLAYTGALVWTFFAGAVEQATPTLVNQASLVRKIWFPREALPLGAVLARALDLALGVVGWCVLALVYGAPVTLAWLWVLPLVLVLLVFASAVALLTSALNVHLRDVKHALPLVLQVGMFASPVVYPFALVPEGWRRVLAWNPLVGVIEGLRSVLAGHAPTLAWVAPGVVVTVATALAAWWIFGRAQRRFADVV